MNKDNFYYYKAHISKVYDGDTVTADVDLGFNVWVHKQSLRLYGIDTPELRGSSREDGLKARDYLRSLVLGKDIIIRTKKDKTGKYGRMLAELFLEDGDTLFNVNQDLLAKNYAVPLVY